MRVHDTELTGKQRLLLIVLASTFLVEGTSGLVAATYLLLFSGETLNIYWMFSIAALPIGIGLLSISRRWYLIGNWVALLQIIGCVVVAFLVLLFHLSVIASVNGPFVQDETSGTVHIYLRLVAMLMLKLWQLWMLNRPYLRDAFGGQTTSQAAPS